MASNGRSLALSAFVVLMIMLLNSVAECGKQPPKDFYKTLDVKKDASSAEIRRAYRKLALKYHPDKNKEKGAEKRWLGIAEAYEVLGNKEKRERYDRYGEDGLNENGPGPGSGFNGEGFSFHFDDMFGGGGFPFDDMFGGHDDFFESDHPHHYQAHYQTHNAHHEHAHDMHFDPFEDMQFDDPFQDGGHHGHGDVFDGFGFNDGMFHDDGDDVFGGGASMFGHGPQGGGGGRGERCRTVTTSFGNMRTTQTICS